MITIEREPFLAALRVAAPVADPKSPIMACANILIRSADGCLSLSAHSTPSQMSIIVDAKGEIDLTLPAKQLLDVVDAARGDLISVADTGEVKSGRSVWKLPKMRADDFPRLPIPPDGGWVSVAGNDLRDLIDSVIWSVTDEMRSGVHIEVRDGSMMVMGMHPTACARARVAVDGKGEIVAFIPKKSAKDLSRFADGCHRVDLQLEERLFVRADDRLLSLNLTSLSLPASVVSDLIDKEKEIPRFDVDRKAFIGSIERVCIAGDLKGCVEMIGKGSSLTLRYSEDKGGAAEEEIEIESTGDFSRGAQGRKLVDALKSFDDEKVSVWPASEIRLSPLGRKAERAALVMEMK